MLNTNMFPNNKTCIFSYGSNSINQIKGRTNNLSLISYSAYIDNFKRIFAGHSNLWNGGVASLVQKRFARTYGIIVFLTDDEIAKLDVYEVNYSKKELECSAIIDNLIHNIKCYTYIKDNHYWCTHPSQQYLTAIKIMLEEHNQYLSYIIVSGIMQDNDKIQNVTKWKCPDNLNLSLESFFVIVNSHKSEPWKMPKILNSLITKFNSINIFTTLMLKKYIEQDNSFELMNKDFIDNEHKIISYETYEIIKKVLV